MKHMKHMKNGKPMGFGFIKFDSMETAANICQNLQGTFSDRHVLTLQFCQVKEDRRALNRTDKDRSSTKLHAKNVASNFFPFGKIKRLRLPRKYGNHRGFVLVAYVAKQEARYALRALANSHLYGRRLALQRAKEGETLEELRARTTARFNDESGYSTARLSKKRKQHMAVLDEDRMKFRRIAA